MISAIFRFLIPSWKFFEDFSEYPILEYRFRAEDGVWGAWLSPPASKPRKISHLFLNAEGNLRMACNSLLEKVLTDVQENNFEKLPLIESMDSFLKLKNLVHFYLHEKLTPETAFQFQISVVNAQTRESQAVVVSRTYEV